MKTVVQQGMRLQPTESSCSSPGRRTEGQRPGVSILRRQVMWRHACPVGLVNLESKSDSTIPLLCWRCCDLLNGTMYIKHAARHFAYSEHSNVHGLPFPLPVKCLKQLVQMQGLSPSTYCRCEAQPCLSYNTLRLTLSLRAGRPRPRTSSAPPWLPDS